MKYIDRRTFLKISGASALTLALAACDGGHPASSGSGNAGTKPDETPMPVIRDGKKVFDVITAEMDKRNLAHGNVNYSVGVEHAIQADVQMFVDYGKAEIPADIAFNFRSKGEYTERMWDGLHEAGYTFGSTSMIYTINNARIGVDLGKESNDPYRLTRVYPRTRAEYQALLDELAERYEGGLSDAKVGITIADVDGVAYWAAMIMPDYGDPDSTPFDYE